MCMWNVDHVKELLTEGETNIAEAFFNSRRAKAFKAYMLTPASPIAPDHFFCLENEHLPQEVGRAWDQVGFADTDPYGQYAGISDIMRLALLYRFGGLYMDADDEVLTPNFVPLWFGTWANMDYDFRWNDCNSNNVMAATKSSEIVKAIREAIENSFTANHVNDLLDPANFKALLLQRTAITDENLYRHEQCYDPMVGLVMTTTGPTKLEEVLKQLQKPVQTSDEGFTQDVKDGWFIKEYSTHVVSQDLVAILQEGPEAVAPSGTAAPRLQEVLDRVPMDQGIVNAQRVVSAW